MAYINGVTQALGAMKQVQNIQAGNEQAQYLKQQRDMQLASMKATQAGTDPQSQVVAEELKAMQMKNNEMQKSIDLRTSDEAYNNIFKYDDYKSFNEMVQTPSFERLYPNTAKVESMSEKTETPEFKQLADKLGIDIEGLSPEEKTGLGKAYAFVTTKDGQTAVVDVHQFADRTGYTRRANKRNLDIKVANAAAASQDKPKSTNQLLAQMAENKDWEGVKNLVDAMAKPTGPVKPSETLAQTKVDKAILAGIPNKNSKEWKEAMKTGSDTITIDGQEYSTMEIAEAKEKEIGKKLTDSEKKYMITLPSAIDTIESSLDILKDMTDEEYNIVTNAKSWMDKFVENGGTAEELAVSKKLQEFGSRVKVGMLDYITMKTGAAYSIPEFKEYQSMMFDPTKTRKANINTVTGMVKGARSTIDNVANKLERTNPATVLAHRQRSNKGNEIIDEKSKVKEAFKAKFGRDMTEEDYNKYSGGTK